MKNYFLLLFLLISLCLSAVDEFTGNCLDFDGINDYVQTLYSGVFGTTPRTFQAWIYLSTAPTGNICITDYGLNDIGSRNTFVVRGDGFLGYISGGTNGNINATVTPVPVGSWVHVAFVYDGTNGFLYQNGVQVGTGLLTAVNTPSTGDDFKIGERVSGGSIPFEGKIDEVSVWDVALTQTEIQDYLDCALTGAETGLVSYWQFNEFSGITATDEVGGHNGTLLNMDDNDWVTSTIPFSIYLNILGSGTSGDPYQISSLDMLRWLSRNGYYWDAHYTQTANINASDTQNWNNGAGFIPIGSLTVNYTGIYDGLGFEIDNLFIDQPATERVGLFAITDAASITNLGVTNVDISGYMQTGAFIGKANDSTISNCYSTGNVNGADDIGGLVGKNDLGATVINCYSFGSVSAGTNAGGLVGFNDNSSSISFCYSTGSVSAGTNAGGLVGNNGGGATVTNSFWDTQTSGQNTSAGGTGLTTAEMQMYSTYFNDGWDFMDETVNGTDDNWGINPDENDGYPFLAWQGYVNNPVSIENNIISEGVHICQNYPNPFNPTTTISFSIPEESNVELTIFNIKGQKVKTLVNSNQDKGNHSAIWNGKDNSGNNVTSGIYFYKMKANNYTATKKMILMK